MNKYTIEQSGRSMIEMLGVLAIVGVLSVAGIAGYSKAMAKYKVNKLVDQVTMTAANIKTTFAGQGDYKGLTNDVAHSLGVFPEEMDKDCGSKSCKPKNAMGGNIEVKATSDTDKYSFDMTVSGITKDACSTLATADWGSAAGFKGIVASVEGCDTGICTPADLQSNAITLASEICKPTKAEDEEKASDDSYSITWRFY